GRYRLAGLFVGAKSGPITFFFVGFIWNGSLYNEYEGIELALGGEFKTLHELVSRLQRQDRMMEVHLRNAGDSPEDDIFEAGLRCRRHRDRIPVTSEAGCNPKNIDFFDYLRSSFTFLTAGCILHCFAN